DGVAESGGSGDAVRGAGPAMRRLHQTRAMPDVLLDVGRRLRRPLDPPFPWQSFEELLHAEAQPRPAAAATREPSSAAVRFAEPRFDGSADEYPFHFLPYASQAFL